MKKILIFLTASIFLSIHASEGSKPASDDFYIVDKYELPVITSQGDNDTIIAALRLALRNITSKIDRSPSASSGMSGDRNYPVHNVSRSASSDSGSVLKATRVHSAEEGGATTSEKERKSPFKPESDSSSQDKSDHNSFIVHPPKVIDFSSDSAASNSLKRNKGFKQKAKKPLPPANNDSE